MTLQSSGAISLYDVQVEFGGSNPIGINEYYSGGSYVPSSVSGIPASGTISLYNFYGKSAGGGFSWSSGIMGTRSIDSNADLFYGNIITPGNSFSPVTFVINSYPRGQYGTYLQLKVGGVLATTFSGTQSGTNYVSYFGSSSVQFVSYGVASIGYATNTDVFVGGTAVFSHYVYTTRHDS